MTSRARPSWFAATAVLVLFACGGATTTQPAPEGPPAPGSAPSVADAGAADASSHAPAPPASAGALSPMPTVAATTMAADLTALGLDVRALPALDKLPPDKLRKVMKTFARSLNTTCTGCHDENDFRAPTRNKKIASGMWNHFVRELAQASDTPLYCDSCHAGKKTFLDRHDKKALSQWMDQNFVAKLKRRDGKDHSCETCHGDPFEGRFLETWAARK